VDSFVQMLLCVVTGVYFRICRKTDWNETANVCTHTKDTFEVLITNKYSARSDVLNST